MPFPAKLASVGRKVTALSPAHEVGLAPRFSLAGKSSFVCALFPAQVSFASHGFPRFFSHRQSPCRNFINNLSAGDEPVNGGEFAVEGDPILAL